MGKVIIQSHTTKNPITLIGEEAGICWGANTEDAKRNYKRGLDCLENEHGRTFEFPDVYMILDGYSARVIREWYTHIGGAPTRLQASTRYINYEDYEVVTPKSIADHKIAYTIYMAAHEAIRLALKQLEKLGIPREDSAMLLPLGMCTKMVDKRNLRNLIDMSHQRMCTRAYHEYRDMFNDICDALRDYSEEWAYLVDNYFMPKCEYVGFCTEKKSCGRKGRRDSR